MRLWPRCATFQRDVVRRDKIRCQRWHWHFGAHSYLSKNVEEW